MLSKNNSNERKRKSELQNKQEHFSLRKLTIGTTSVLLGFSFIQANSQVVKADTIKGTDETNVTANKADEAAAKQKEAVPAKSKQANLATYAGLTSFLRGELEVPQESQGSTSSAAASSAASSAAAVPASTAASTGSAATSAASSAAAAPASTATSTGMGSAAIDSAASVDSTPDAAGAERLPEPEPVTVGPQADDAIKYSYGYDGNCTWKYDTRSKTITFTAMADNSHVTSLAAGMLNSGNILTAVQTISPYDPTNPANASTKFSILVNEVKVINFDKSNGQIKLPASCYQLFSDLRALKEIDGLDEVDTSAVTDMRYMFYNDYSLLKLKLDNWDMTNVRYIDCMFYNDPALKTLTMANSTNSKASADRNCLSLDYNVFGGDSALTKLVLPRIRISNLPNDAFGPLKNNLRTLDVSQLDTYGVTNLGTYYDYGSSAFSHFGNLTEIIGIDKLDVSQVTNMADMFCNDSKLQKLDLSGWDTRNLGQENYDDYAPGDASSIGSAYRYYGMASMFEGDSSLQEIILGPNWSTGNNIGHPVNPIPAAGNYTNASYSMYRMFYGDTKLKTIRYEDASSHVWEMGHVAHAERMFSGANNLTKTSLANIGVSKWDTSNLKNAESMFSEIGSLTTGSEDALTELDLHTWNTSNVTNMTNMFSGASSLTNLNLSDWDTSKVTDMSNMFSNASGLTTVELSNWNTSSVTNMTNMFYNASSLTNLNLSNWDTSRVTNMSSMFYNASKLQELNLGRNGETSGNQVFVTTNSVANMSNMFYGTGSANDQAHSLHLRLGDFQIADNAWNGFDGSKQYPLDVLAYNGSSQGTITYQNLKNRYSSNSRSDTDNVYVVLLHKADKERYKLQITGNYPTIMEHKNLREAIGIDTLTELNSVKFNDTEDGGDFSIDALKGREDYFKNKSYYTIASVAWSDSKAIDSTGAEVDGGAISKEGFVTPDAANIVPGPNALRANAVIEVTFGNGEVCPIPIIVKIPKIEAGTRQYTQLRTIPSATKAKLAVKIDGQPATNGWGATPENNNTDKWTLDYKWVKNIGTTVAPNWVPLVDSDSNDLDQHKTYTNIGVEITYSQPSGKLDGVQDISVPLEVKNYNDAYKIIFNSSGALHLHEKTTASGKPISLTASQVGPVEFDDPTTWSQFLDVRPRDGFASAAPITEGLSEIIKSVKWKTEPTLSNLGINSVTNQLEITYQDGATTDVGDSSDPVKVNYSGGRPSGNTKTISINHSDDLDTVAAKNAIDHSKVDDFYKASYSWSKDAEITSTPDVSHVGHQTVYVLIDYHDGNKQAVPVDLNVTAMKDDYTPHVTAGKEIIIHRTDHGDAFDAQNYPRIPVITDPAMIDNLLTLKDGSDTPFLPPVSPSSVVSKIVWDTSNTDIPASDGADVQNHKLQIVYTDGSHELTEEKAAFKVEGVSINASATGVTQSGSNYKAAYIQGTVPAAETLVKEPTSFHFSPTYKWVKNDSTHAELPLSDLNTASGEIDAAIEVTYSDSRHQYLPIKLTINTRAGVSRCSPIDQTVHVNKRLNLSDLVSVKMPDGVTDVNTSEYQLSWVDGAPDLSVASLAGATAKQIQKKIRVTFNRGESFQDVRVTITLVGAQLNPSAVAKKDYLGSSGMNLSEDNVKDIASYYLDTSTVNSIATYSLEQTGDTVTLTVKYNDDNWQQVFTDIPLELVRGEISNNAIHADQYTVFGTNDIKRILLNYDKVASTGATIDKTITGINLAQPDNTHPQIGNFRIYYPADQQAGLPEVTETIPVKVMVSHIDGDDPKAKPVVSKSKAVKLLSGSVIVPQHTDLAAHNEYAKGAVTSVNAMPDGCEYVWDKDHIPATDKEGTYSSFVNVRYPNGTFVSVPVKVTVVGPTLNEAILMHNSYIYNQDANRVTNRVLQQGLKVKTYGTALLEGKLYYHLEGNQYVKAGNIDGQKRKLIKTSYVYDKSGQRIADKTIYEGTEITTYGAHVKIKHGKYYAIGINEFIKADAVNKFITEKS